MTRKAWLLFIAISLFWGIPYLFIKIAVRQLDPGVLVFARVGIAALVLVPIALQRGLFHDLRGRWGMVILIATIHIIGPFLLISYGEQYISSALTSILIASEPLLIALLALRFDADERVRGLRLVGLLIGMIGVIVLLGLDVRNNVQQLLGAGFVLLAATGYATTALLVKRPEIVALPRLGLVAAECMITTVVLLPLALTRLPTTFPTVDVLLSLLVLGLICTALALLVFLALIAEVGASRGSVFTYINPLISVLLGITFLHEPLTIAIIAGFFLILLGSWLSTGGSLPLLIKRFRLSGRSPYGKADIAEKS